MRVRSRVRQEELGCCFYRQCDLSCHDVKATHYLVHKGGAIGTVERTYRGSCHRIYRSSVPQSRHPSHSVIDIIVDCLSVSHGLPAFLYNVLIMLLNYIF